MSTMCALSPPMRLQQCPGPGRQGHTGLHGQVRDIYSKRHDFNLEAQLFVSRSLERTASLNRDEGTEAERVRYMEKILAHHVPGISFDIESLRKVAEDLEKQHQGSDVDGPPTQVELEELEDLAIDDEDFTIKALPDNTTRKSWLSFPYNICREFN